MNRNEIHGNSESSEPQPDNQNSFVWQEQPQQNYAPDNGSSQSTVDDSMPEIPKEEYETLVNLYQSANGGRPHRGGRGALKERATILTNFALGVLNARLIKWYKKFLKGDKRASVFSSVGAGCNRSYPKLKLIIAIISTN